MRILESVSREPEGFTVIQLAEMFSLNRGTCSTIVQSLAEEGYLIKIEKTRNYILGPRVYGLSRRRYFLHCLVAPAKSSIDALSRRLGYPCVLAVVFQDRYYLLYTTGQEMGIPHDDELVFLEDVSTKATGRVLLSMLSSPDLDRFVKKNPATERNWPSGASVASGVAEVRKQGFAVSASRGYMGMSVPVGDTSRGPLALGLYLYKEEFSVEKQERFIPQLKDTAAIITREYGRGI